MKPIIALTPSVDINGNTSILKSYIDAIEDAGGIPILLPYTQNVDTLLSYIDICHGICLTGGIDVDPKRYGEEKMTCCGDTQDNRDVFDISILGLAINASKPILGICRGMQLINVALGGTLYQDIPTEVITDIRHIQTEDKLEHSHEANVIKDTPLYSLVGEEKIKINSFHHQAIKELAEGLEVMARADDGIIEAVYAKDYKYLRAYQWHPERICHIDKNQVLIFEDFINACKE